MTTIAILRILGGVVFFAIGAFHYFAPYPSVLDRAPRADDPVDREAKRVRARRLVGALYMFTGLLLVALNTFIPD